MDGAEIKITEEDGLDLDDEHWPARRSTFKHFEKTMDQFQQCKVEMATKSLQAAYKYLLELNPDSLGNPTDYEKEQVKRGTELCFNRSSAPPLLGAVLSSPEPIADNDGHFHALFTTVFGAVALKLHNYNMAIDVFKRCTSLFTCDVAPRPKNNTEVIDIFEGLAKANIGCVYLITKMIDKAQDHLKCALEIFETYKSQSKNASVEISIFTIQTNLSLVYQYQKDYPAAVKLLDCLLTKAKDFNLPPHLIAAIHYNRVELLLALKEPVKALTELGTLDSLSERVDKGDGIFAKFISSKICLAYQMAGEEALAEEIAERLKISFRSPKSLSPPLSLSSKSLSSASGSASSSSSSLSSSTSSLLSSFSFFFPDFKAPLDGCKEFYWDFLYAVILNFTDFLLNEGSLEFLSFLDVFVPICREMLGENHPTLASLLYRQGVRFSLMKLNLSSKKYFEEALSILISFDLGSDHQDLVQCNIALAKLLLLEDLQDVPPLKSCPDQSWRELPFDPADGDVSSDIPSRTNVSNSWDNNEELELLQTSGLGKCKGKPGDCLGNGSQKDKNRGMIVPPKTLQTPNAVSDECNDTPIASCQEGIVIADSGEGPDVLTTNGACGFDKEWSSPPRQGDSNKSNLKTKRSLGLKGGLRNYFPSGHTTQRDPNEDDYESIHIGINPSFLARHSDEYWDSCGPFNDLEVPPGIHSVHHRSGYTPERNYLALTSSSTLSECPDLTKCCVGDHSAHTSAMGSPPQTNINPDGYQPKESYLNLVLMPKTVPVKTSKPPPSSNLPNDGFKTNLPLTVTEFPTGNIQARTPPNISTDVYMLSGRPMPLSQFERANKALGILPDRESAVAGPGLLNSNSNTSADESLAALERSVAEACSLVERTLKERQEREKALKETEKKRKEERARKEQEAHERKEREAKETRERGHRKEKVEGNAISDGGETPSQDSAVAEVRQWLCEHYQRLCRVKFPCCGKFFPCHRCHNNSGCPNDNSKAREACSVECSICSHQQEMNQDAHTCARCKTRFSAYFCSVCKHFTGEDKAPYHCNKCGICRIYKDRSFHCDVCNVCLDKRLEGRHSCRENSGHDECCICLEDAFSGCQILPCSHKVHRECAIAMIQNGVRSCPICRHPLYSSASGNE